MTRVAFLAIVAVLVGAELLERHNDRRLIEAERLRLEAERATSRVRHPTGRPWTFPGEEL